MDNGADANKANSKDQTPLMLASKYAENKLSMAKALVEKGAEVSIMIKDENGHSVHDYRDDSDLELGQYLEALDPDIQD